MLADADTVSRSLIGAGQLEPVVDAWWVGDPPAQAAQALDALDLGRWSPAPGDRRAGPRAVRVSVPAALITLVVAAVVLLLAGIALVTARTGGAGRRSWPGCGRSA